ncbi:MAG: hypothetical protein QN229_02600 [Desulfurococcaceae archaeon TW002]
MINSLLKVSILLLLAGFMLVFLAMLLPILTLGGQATTPSGVAGCVILFFIPICFGFGESGILPFMIMLSLALTLILVVFTFLIFRKLARDRYAE